MMGKRFFLLFIGFILLMSGLVFAQYVNYQNPNNVYSTYNQNPNYYNQYSNRNNPVPSNVNYGNRFDNQYYYGNQNVNRNTYVSSGNYNPSRNVQYVDPRYQSNSYGSFNSYSNTGQFGYTQGSGAFGASGLYGYGQTGSGFGFNQQLCANNLNFLIHIAPGGCSPAVVRSDLLEEQNVPVYCKLTSFQSNPLLSGTRIRSMSIRGEYPRGVSGVSYFPGRSALRNQGLFNSGTGGFGGGVGNSFSSYGTSGSYGGFGNQYASSPINDDMGYIVIVLNRQANESSMPDFVTGNITAVVDYDTAGGYGTGNTVLYLDELSEEDWQRDFRESSIWGGRGYVRADSIDDNTAVISMYRDANNREGSVQLREGQTSGILSLGGNYCSAGFRLFLEKISAPVDSALLTINGEQVWVANGDRVINDRCRVNGLEITGGGGKVQISCPGDRVDLSLSSGVASFEVDGNERSISVNERIKDNLFLGYIGRIDGSDFAVVIEDSSSNSELSFADKEIFETIEGIKDKKDIDTIRNKVLEQYRKKLGSVKYKEVKDSLRVLMIDNEGPNDGIRIDNVLLIQDQTEFNNELSRIYYDKSINSYQDLHDFYPSERVAEGEEPLSAQGLYEAFKLSRRFNMNVRAQEFARQLIEGYPDSFWADNVRLEGDNLFKYDRTNARSSVDVDGVGYSVDLIEFRKPSREDASAVFLISGKEVNLGIGDFTNENDVNIQLLSLDDNSADIQYEYDDVNSDKISRREELVMGGKDQTSINGVNVKLVNVELKQQARVRVLPNLAGSRTEVPLSFNIAIEKRLIQLSPERTREFIDNLKKAIKNWEDVNRKLGTVIKTMKGACFATSAILTTKSLFDGYSGTSLARTRVMTGPNGWNKKCEELVSKKEYTTLQQCLLGNKDKIEQDVKALSGQISGTNQIIKGIQGQVEKTPGGIFGIGSQYDQTQIEELFKKRFDSFCAGIKDKEVTLPGQGGNKVTYGEVCKWENLDYKQQREIMTLYNAQGGSEVLESYRENELSRIVNEAKLVEDAEQTRIISEQNANKFNLGLGTTNPVGDKTTYGNVKVIGGAELNAGNVLKNFEKGDQVVRVFIPTQKQITGGEFKAHEDVAGKEVIVKVNEVAGNPGVFSPDSSKIKIYTIEGKEITDLNATASVFDYMSLAGLNKIRQTSDKALVNPMVDVNNLRVQYFDRAPYRGLPSTIPFDIKNGWYVRMNYVTSGFGTPYDESGRVTNYYICNVGPNGKIEFKGGDDICRYYNGVHSDLSFPGMTGSESSVLVGKAQQAIRSASGQYGKEKVTINGQTFETGVSFDDTQGQCTDFMSPSDCNIMFNVCDPVICPASRCDLGGRYRVDNVIQTGIVGSLSLCLPNFQEGIAVPICLSGVHAGLDGYISILNSTVSCLNESLETGRNVGICDEIKSVYMCDFFYKQAVPFVSALFEESFSGSQGVRGGGEYLTVSSAWDNTQGAMDYFTNHYAVNSIQAFNFRQLGQVQTADTGSYVGGGGSFCSSFISSGVTGSSGGFLDALIQPDSPTQYHAWFSEDKLTTATVPPTSHYKVYFNIFAGKDIGSYYSVYLKDLPSTPGIFSTGFFNIDSGYVPRSGSVDKARDFTASSGFKQLCININGREECGFGQVSTSYLLNSISDSYLEEQALEQVTSERECVSGSPSVYSVFQPNVQAGIGEALNPQLYNRGIVRICASENPGKQVLPTGEFDRTNSRYDRWKEVGYCGDPSLKCWLDTSSVKEVVRDTGIEQNILDQVDLNSLGVDNYMVPDVSEAILSQGWRLIEDIPRFINIDDDRAMVENIIGPTVSRVEQLTSLGSTNLYRARAYFVLANIYRVVSEHFDYLFDLKDIEDNPIPAPDVGGVFDEVEVEPGVTVVIFNLDNRYGFRYTYSTEKWTSDNEEANNDLSNRNYVEGIRYIVSKVEEGGELWVGNDVIEAKVNVLVSKLDEVKNGVVQNVREGVEEEPDEENVLKSGKSKYRFKGSDIVDDETLESTEIYLKEENSIWNLYLRTYLLGVDYFNNDVIVGRIDLHGNVGEITINYDGKWTDHMKALDGLFIDLEDEEEWIYYSIE